MSKKTFFFELMFLICVFGFWFFFFNLKLLRNIFSDLRLKKLRFRLYSFAHPWFKYYNHPRGVILNFLRQIQIGKAKRLRHEDERNKHRSGHTPYSSWSLSSPGSIWRNQRTDRLTFNQNRQGKPIPKHQNTQFPIPKISSSRLPSWIINRLFLLVWTSRPNRNGHQECHPRILCRSWQHEYGSSKGRIWQDGRRGTILPGVVLISHGMFCLRFL